MATTVEKIYKLDIQGTDSVNELKTAIEELNDKLKTLNATSQEYKDTLAELTEYQSKLADAMKGISDSSQTTNDSLNTIKDTVDSVAESISTLGDDALNAFAEGLGQGMAEAAQEVLQLGDSMENGVNSVKDLKQHISDLRDTLVTLDKGSDDYKATVQELVDAQVKLKEVMNAGKNEVQAAEGSYNALSQRMSALKQVWKEATDEATRDEIGRQIAEINAQLKGMDASIGNFQRNVGNYKSALDGLDGSFVNLKTQLRECKEAMQQLDPASQEYADAMARAAEITHQLSEQQEQIKYASTDVGDQLENVRGIATNMAAGYSAINAAMGLFGEENEEVAQAMLKVQQAMALVQGLQGIDGFIKRTKGLSQSMGLVTKATQANTVATKANATASKQDAVAKGAETVATEAAVPAQLSLNAAMEANPIGFIIGLIATLVTVFMLLKDKIMEMIGANEDMSKAFNKVKAVLAGVGNVIKKSVINPIKLAIIPIKTFAKMLIDLFKGDWSKIADDFKEGMTEMKDTTIDTINVVGAFKEGYDKKTAEQNEAARKAEAEARSKERDSYIKDMEAKYGADWKYTEKGKKVYMEYFRDLAAMYDEDSEEYKQALRDKEAYLRDFREHQKEEAEKQEAWELRLGKAYYGADYEFSKEWYQKKYNAWKEIEDQKWLYEMANQMDAYKKHEVEWLEYLDRYNKHWESKTKEGIKAVETILNNFKSAFKKYMPDMVATSIDYNELIEKWNKGLTYFKNELRDKYKMAESDIEAIVTEMHSKFVAGMFDAASKNLKTRLDRDIYNLDRTLRDELSVLNDEFSKKEIMFGINIPQDKINHIKEVFLKTMDVLERELKMTEKDIDFIVTSILQKPEEMAEMLGENTYNAISGQLTTLTTLYADYYEMVNRGDELMVQGFTEDAEFMYSKAQELYDSLKSSEWVNDIYNAFGLNLPEFQKLLDERNALISRKNKEELDLFKQNANIKLAEYQKEDKAIEDRYARELNNMQFMYDQEQLLQEKRSQWYQGNNVIEQLQKQRDFQRAYYDEVINMYQEQMRQYKAMSEDMTLTDEQRRNALAEFERLRFETEKALQDKQRDDLKTTRDIYKEWTNVVKNSISDIGSIMSSLADSWSSLINLEKEAIETELENGDIREDEAKRREEANKEAFNKLKAFQIATTIINTIAGAIGAFLQASSAYPPPWGQILGGVSAAAVAAAGYAEVKQIQATEYGDSSIGKSSAGSSSTSFQLPDVMATEPDLRQNLTGMDDTDSLNNAGGNGNGKGGETAIKAYVVESDVSASQELARKRNQEVTF